MARDDCPSKVLATHFSRAVDGVAKRTSPQPTFRQLAGEGKGEILEAHFSRAGRRETLAAYFSRANTRGQAGTLGSALFGGGGGGSSWQRIIGSLRGICGSSWQRTFRELEREDGGSPCEHTFPSWRGNRKADFSAAHFPAAGMREQAGDLGSALFASWQAGAGG